MDRRDARGGGGDRRRWGPPRGPEEYRRREERRSRNGEERYHEEASSRRRHREEDEFHQREDERPSRRPRRSRFSDEPPPGAGHEVMRPEQAGLIIPEASTKPRRELFVGNTTANMNERALLETLNSAMTTSRMAIAPGQPVLHCRKSNNYAFIELRSVEETDRALSLNGIPFMGNMLKIGRPSKYQGPSTPSTTWQEVLAAGDFVRAMSSKGADTNGGTESLTNSFIPTSLQQETTPSQSNFTSSLDPTAIEKLRRELFVGNTTPLMTEVAIRAFLGMVARQLGQTIAPGDPILSLRLSGHFAFIELRSIEETNAMLRFNGIPFMGAKLKVGRPSKFSQAGLPDDKYADLRWEDTLDLYRNHQLPKLTPETKETTSSSAKENPPLSFDQVIQLANVVGSNATRTLQIKNILDDTRFQRDDDDFTSSSRRNHTHNDNEQRRRTAIIDGVKSDVEKECSKFGQVLQVTPVDDLHINIEFSILDSAILAFVTLRYKTFDTYPCDLKFIPNPRLEDIQPPPFANSISSSTPRASQGGFSDPHPTSHHTKNGFSSSSHQQQHAGSYYGPR